MTDLKARMLSAARRGDAEEVVDAVMEAWIHHGVMNGNVQALDRAARASVIVAQGRSGGLKRLADQIAGVAVKALPAPERPAHDPRDEPDYEAALAEDGE